MDVIVGTAGHIDHGKTSLIKALTGIDTDRFPEEKKRGITIDLGFAELDLGGVHIGFVDVPGHERFVKNMLAGASGIDIVMLVVAANEGVMPQTREHFEICRLLGVEKGVIALTKVDLVDIETLELAKLELAELVSGSSFERAPVVCVSVRTGDGFDALKIELSKIASDVGPRETRIVPRLAIDRSFSIKGSGAVVTGTLASGHIEEGTEMELLPGGMKVRIRGIQVHKNNVKNAGPGQRVAVNLGGIAHTKVKRGMVLTHSGSLHPTRMFDANVEVPKDASRPIRTRQRIRVHLGTVEVLARVQVINGSGEIKPGECDLVQVRLESPVVAVPGDRFIIRSYSPPTTVAGGLVLDNGEVKHRQKDIFEIREYLTGLQKSAGPAQNVITLLSKAGRSGMSISDLLARTGFQKNYLLAAVNNNVASAALVDCQGVYLTAHEFDNLLNQTVNAIEDFHTCEPLAKGMPREALRANIFGFLPENVFQAVINSLESSGRIKTRRDIIGLATHEVTLSPAETILSKKILTTYVDAGLEVPKFDEVLTDAASVAKLDTQTARKLFAQFLDSGELVKVTDEFYFAKNVIDKLTAMLRKRAERGDNTIDVTQFKDLAAVSRKYAIPLLEYFDRTRVTVRSGGQRIIL